VRDFFQSSSEFKQYAQLLFLIHLHFQSSSEFKYIYCMFESNEAIFQSSSEFKFLIYDFHQELNWNLSILFWV